MHVVWSATMTVEEDSGLFGYDVTTDPNIGSLSSNTFDILVLQLQKCGEEFQAASVMAAPGRCLVPPSPPGPPQH